MMRLVVFLELGLAVAASLPAAAQEHPHPPFDLVAERRDLNGLMLNPSWGDSSLPSTLDPDRRCGILALHGAPGYRRVLLRRGDCLGDEQRNILRLNEPQVEKFGGFICAQTSEDGSVHGHVNWFPITLTGSLRFEKSMGGEGDDYDVNFDMLSRDRWPVTRYNWRQLGRHDSSQIHLELDYRETLRRLPATPLTWWTRFQALVRDSSAEQVDTFLHRGRLSAVITGLFGLDNVHNGHAEMHPVYAMAFTVRIDTVDQRELRQQWVFLARDRGNEGNCATGKIPFRLGAATDSVNTYRFLIEKPEGTSDPPVIERDSSWIGVAEPAVGSGLRFYYAATQGLEVAVSWPPPSRDSEHAMMVGVLQVVWRGRFVPKPPAPGGPPEAIIAQSQLGPKKDDVKRHGGAGGPDAMGLPVHTDTTWDDRVLQVDTLPHAGPVPPTATEPFDPLQPVVLCDSVHKSWNPRCHGDWSLSPFLGLHLAGVALNRTGGIPVFGLGLESLRMDPFPDYLGRNVHLRPGLLYVQRRPADDPHRIQGRVAAQLGILLGPFTWSLGTYFMVNPEFGASHESTWDRATFELSLGPGMRIVNGRELDLAIELLRWVSKDARPYYVVALRAPIVVHL
ncbi:MAG TPA: hypothetical protein VI653_18770 [Steroidobacteraceae bacterium]